MTDVGHLLCVFNASSPLLQLVTLYYQCYCQYQRTNNYCT